MLKYAKQFIKFLSCNFYIILQIIISKLNSLDNAELIKKEKASIHDIKILHHSKNYIIVNKRYDVLMNSNNVKDKVTLQTQLRHLFPELVNPKLKHEFTFVHRLDFATSGILCLPINKKACKFATQGFEKRTVDKFYLAIVRGHVSQDALQIDVGIGEDTRPEFNGIRMALEGSPFVGAYRQAFTKVLVLERGISHGFPATKVLLKPLTGRRHQLRLHMSILGHTIVGDFTYSNRHDVVPFRMFLHAFRFVLSTPLEQIDVQTADPFLPHNPCNKWSPVEFVNKLDSHAMLKLKEDNRMKVISVRRPGRSGRKVKKKVS